MPKPSSTPFDPWRQIYNHERPHEALGLSVPARHYAPSPRPFPETLPPLAYDTAGALAVRAVQQGGWISWQGHPYQVGGAFVGQPVAVAPTDAAGLLAVYFADHWIASLDTRSHCVYPVSQHAAKRRSVVNDVPEHL